MTKYEMWDVARVLKPGITWTEYEAMWEEFVALKRSKQIQ